MLRSVLCLIAIFVFCSPAIAGTEQPPPGDGWTCYQNCVAFTQPNAQFYCDSYASQGKLTYLQRNGTHTNGDPLYSCWYAEANPCPYGEYDQATETCPVDPTDCSDPSNPSGSVYNSQSESCSCPSGQTDYLATDGSYSCVNDLQECSPSNPGFLGFVNNTAVCTYDGGCEEGQTGGVVNGDWMCVTEPDCTGTWINGSCISPDDPTPSPENTDSKNDTDGDGVPDSSDPDIDGDGIPNSTDDDIDGDGVLNADDQSNEKESEASGGGTCESAPICQGDAIQCAQLQQQWLSRCGTQKSYEESTCSVQPSCDGDPLQCQALLNDWEYECATESAADDAESEYQSAGLKTADDYAAEGGVFGEGESHDIDAVAGDVLASRSAIAGSCPAPKQLDLGVFGTTEITFQAFCDLADMIYWIVMLSAYLTATFILFRSITN